MKKVWLSLAFVPLYVAGTAQEKNMLQRYPNEQAVITTNTEHTTFFFSKGLLQATTAVNEEILMLTDKAPAMYNTYNIHHGNFSRLGDIKAVTLVPSGNDFREVKARDFKTTKATASGVFYDDAQQTQITFTGLVKGAKTVVEYELEHEDIHFMPSFYFQSHLPTAVSECKITVPKSVKLKWQLAGMNTDKVQFSTDESRHEVTYTWTARDMNTFKRYEFAPGAAHYIPHLIAYIESYTPPRSGEPVKVFGTVDDLYRFYYPFVRDINKTVSPELQAIVRSLTEQAKSEKEKAERIYQYVQQHIKYVAFEDGMGGFIPREAAAVCARKYGDCKDMSSLLVTLCREAGLQAYYTWIGTRDRPYKYHVTPFPIADNHMICTVHIGDEWIILDGTDSQIPFGIPPAAIQGKEALIAIDKEHYKIIEVPVVGPEQNIMADTTHISLAGKDISGSVHIDVSGYRAWDIHRSISYYSPREKEDYMRAFLSRGSNKYLQRKFDYKVSEQKERNALFSADFEIKDYAQQAGKEWYINMNLLRPYENQYIDTKERAVPIEYDYKNIIRQVVVLDIPKGYHVSYVPPSVEKGMDNLWDFRISYKTSPSQVTMIKEYRVRTLYLENKDFLAHNQLINELKKQHKESIVLTADQ